MTPDAAKVPPSAGTNGKRNADRRRPFLEGRTSISPSAIRALRETKAGTADGSGLFPSLTLRQGLDALAPLTRLSPYARHRRKAYRIITFIITITPLYYKRFSLNDENVFFLIIILTITVNALGDYAAFTKERTFSRMSYIICDNVNNT